LSADIFNVANMVKKSWGVNKSLGTQALYGAGIPPTANTPAVPAFDAEARRFVLQGEYGRDCKSVGRPVPGANRAAV
jgi:hypothetical protein